MPEPRDARFGDLQVWLPWCRRVRGLALAALQLDLHGSYHGSWHRDIQQGAEEFYGYGVDAAFHHHPLLQFRCDHPSMLGQRVCAASAGIGVRGDCGE